MSYGNIAEQDTAKELKRIADALETLIEMQRGGQTEDPGFMQGIEDIETAKTWGTIDGSRPGAFRFHFEQRPPLKAMSRGARDAYGNAWRVARDKRRNQGN